jgi:hypothetical protein
MAVPASFDHHSFHYYYFTIAPIMSAITSTRLSQTIVLWTLTYSNILLQIYSPKGSSLHLESDGEATIQGMLGLSVHGDQAVIVGHEAVHFRSRVSSG